MTKKVYVVYKSTFKNLADIFEKEKAKGNGGGNFYDPKNITLWQYTPKRQLTEAQMQRQRADSWQTNISIDMVMYDMELEKMAEKELYNVVKDRYKGDIYKEIENRMLNKEFHACIEFTERPNGTYHTSRYVTVDGENTDKYMNDDGEEKEYIDNEEELKHLLDIAKLDRVFHGNSDGTDFVYIENAEVKVYDYRIERVMKQIPKAVKKKVKDLLVYCLKNGKLIVPDEYLDKGKEGIIEWQEKKRSSNKNNSMEKRLIRDTLREKKRFAADCVHQTTHLIATTNSSWSVPSLEVDGRWNQSRVGKLVTQTFKEKEDQDIIQMDRKEMLDAFKEYWKKILMDAYNAVDNCTVEDVEKAYGR